jgi:histone deacetylase 6
MFGQDADPYTASMDEKSREAQVLELVCYLWDNYLQLLDPIDDIFLMGVGNAYVGVKSLLMNRGEVSLV